MSFLISIAKKSTVIATLVSPARPIAILGTLLGTLTEKPSPNTKPRSASLTASLSKIPL